MIDTIHAVPDARGRRPGTAVAGPVPRSLAWTVRLGLQGLRPDRRADRDLDGPGQERRRLRLDAIAAFLVVWFYPVLFEVLGHGQTPGKRMLRIPRRAGERTPVGWSASVLRNFLLVADFCRSCISQGWCRCVSTKSFRRLGDLAAGGRS